MADPVALALIAIPGLATAIGGIAVLALRSLSHRFHHTVLGFVAGIMLGVAVFDLLAHMVDHMEGDWNLIAASFAIGAVVIIALIAAFRRMPLPMPFVRNSKPIGTGPAFLLFIALVIHNAPEGLATGVGYGHGLSALGHTIAIAIAMQNIPEGLLVAVAVMKETGSRRAGFGYAAISGVVEPVAGYLAFFVLTLSPQALGAISAFAAGAMLAVVFFQIIPESHRHGHRIPATFALVVGIVVVLLMNMALGVIGV